MKLAQMKLEQPINQQRIKLEQQILINGEWS